MDTIAEIRITQRTALGRDDSGVTSLYAYTYATKGRPDLVRFSDELPDGRDIRVLGRIDIIRPAIMWGDHDDIMGDYIRLCRAHFKAKPQPGMYVGVGGDLCYEG